ncbi:WLM-domain-containing protein [Acephala macrosclerotiorum]|nr:WLM-domain-containing protein [Acephala macrosclerotiorum]
MPLGWERLNARTSQPNKNIVFIKPLPGPDHDTSKDFLERIAAQCLPICNKHHLAVASLEEYEPNLEFWGRNFNGGEVIQLVLKSPSTGRWLPFKFVQMVMMHELAHNKQMNHSKAFWAVRNEISAEMKSLWDKGYTGDGLWGRGVLLHNRDFDREELGAGEILPEHFCGGTFRSKGGRKRKAKPKITYKERQERRIAKKFGMNGVALGADEETKAKLEKGKRPVGKPRVAGSVRGRELRAAAALARFETKKEEPEIKDEDLVTDSEAESDTDDPKIKAEPDDAIDINGLRLTDSKGGGMVRVCGEENSEDDDVKRELLDLQGIPGHAQQYLSSKPASLLKQTATVPRLVSKASMSISKKDVDKTPQNASTEFTGPTLLTQSRQQECISAASEDEGVETSKPATVVVPNVEGACPVCSVENEPTALTCIVCSNVLKPDFVPNTWHCNSSACKDGVYLNSGDVNLCGVCGARKSS